MTFATGGGVSRSAPMDAITAGRSLVGWSTKTSGSGSKATKTGAGAGARSL